MTTTRMRVWAVAALPLTAAGWNWFAKRPRFHVHYTSTYGSWLSLVER